MIRLGALLLAACLGGRGEGTPAEPPVPPAPPPTAPPPNVLVIVWDTVRVDRTSLGGHAVDTTPKTRAWAEARGVIHDRAVSPGVFTLPSHASLFTGLPVRAHGVNADATRLDPALATFAEALGASGYTTWAFVANPYLAKGSGLLSGFDAVEAPWDDRWREAVRAHVVGKRIEGDASTAISPAWPHGGRPNRYFWKDAGPVAATALGAFLDARPADRPFLAFVNLMEAHLPRVPSLAARQAVMRPEAVARSLTLEQDTEAFHAWMTGLRTYDRLDLAAIAGVYDATLLELDAATAELLAALDARGLTDDTLVVLLSDHGESLGEHGLLLHKYGVWNSLSRVPLVIAWPGHLPPRHEAAPFPVEDALVEAARLGGLPVSGALTAQLAARPRPPAGGAVTEYDAVADDVIDRLEGATRRRLDRRRLDQTWSALELGRWKVVVGSEGAVRLYDMVSDPGELRDRTAKHPDAAARMRSTLLGWQEAHPARAALHEEVARGGELEEALRALGYLR